MSDLSWRLQKLKERQEMMKKNQANTASNKANRNSDSNVDYTRAVADEQQEVIYTNNNPLYKYNLLYDNSNNNNSSSNSASASGNTENSPLFARRHSDFSTASNNTDSARASMYSNGSQSSTQGNNLGNLINQNTPKKKSYRSGSETNIQIIPRKATTSAGTNEPEMVLY